MSNSSSQHMAWPEYTPPTFLRSRQNNSASETCPTCGSSNKPPSTGEDIIQLVMLNELRDAEDKVERDQAKLKRDQTKLDQDRATLTKQTTDFEAAMRRISDQVNHERRLQQGEQRAFERQRLEILETLRAGRVALQQDRIAYWVDVHAQSEARKALEKGKAALERAEVELRLEREALELEKQDEDKKVWKRVGKWLGRR